jgi:hypothetical protein
MHTRPITPGFDRARARQQRLARAIVRVVLVLAVCGHVWGQSLLLTVERDGDRLRVSAPGFHFLAGRPLERLHDGASVTYVLSLSLQVESGDGGHVRVTRQVVFSYDLWEEKYSVVQADAPKHSVSHLAAAAAEAWCLDLLTLPVRAMPVAKTFVLKLDCAVRDEDDRAGEAPSASTLTGLIDVLSRKARAASPRWEAASRPLRLADLKDRSTK